MSGPAADGGTDLDAGPGSAPTEPPADPVPPEPPTAVDIGLVAQYRAVDDDPRDDVISPALRVTNRSASDGIPLASLRVRYYFTNEHADLCPEDCVAEVDWAGIQPAGDAIRARSRYVAEGDMSYLEVSFPLTAPTLALSEDVEVHQQFHTTPYKDFDESDDYSFERRRATFADSQKITVYQDETLVWGIPPTP
jgi:hypothetical protein